MNKIELSNKNKSQILNVGVILLVFFVAFKFYQSAQSKITELNLKKQIEINKNQAAESVLGSESILESYKGILVKKDISSVMNTVADLAKTSNLKVVSIKPGDKETFKDYIKLSFNLVVNAPSYHALGKFVSQMESQKDIYLVDAIVIDSANVDQNSAAVGTNLTVNLTVSTISYL